MKKTVRWIWIFIFGRKIREKLKRTGGSVIGLYILYRIYNLFSLSSSSLSPSLFFHPQDRRIQRILELCPSLQEAYEVPRWCESPWIQIIVMSLFERFFSIEYAQSPLILSDGGQVRLDWHPKPPSLPHTSTLDLSFPPPSSSSSSSREQLGKFLVNSATPSIPFPVMECSRNSPRVVCFLPTLTGHSKTVAPFVSYAVSRGWKTVVLNRRGNGQTLSSPRFNLLGDVDDTAAMVACVQQTYPDAFLGMVGLSAGSGQLVSYLGREGGKTPIKAACCLSPAYDVSTAFEQLEKQRPSMSSFLAGVVKKEFLEKNSEILGGVDGYEECMNAKSLHQFLQSAAPFAGPVEGKKWTWNDYLNHSNPMTHFKGNQTPCLVLNSEDDPLCLKDAVQTKLFSVYKNYLLALTKCGSHVSFREGTWGQLSWMERISMDFLDACWAQYFEEKERWDFGTRF